MPSTPRKSSSKKPKPEAPAFSPEALDQLLEGHRTPEAFFGAGRPLGSDCSINSAKRCSNALCRVR